MSNTTEIDKEVKALGVVLGALEPMSPAQQKFILQTVANRLSVDGVVVGNSNATNGLNNSGQIKLPEKSTSANGGTPKEFLKEKKPVSELQRLVCLAYFLTHVRSTPHFKTSDLSQLNTEAAGGKLSNASTTVRNGTAQSHFFAPAGKGGLKQITPHGEEYVEALPDQDAAQSVVNNNRTRRRKPTKKRKNAKG